MPHLSVLSPRETSRATDRPITLPAYLKPLPFLFYSNLHSNTLSIITKEEVEKKKRTNRRMLKIRKRKGDAHEVWVTGMTDKKKKKFFKKLSWQTI